MSDKMNIRSVMSGRRKSEIGLHRGIFVPVLVTALIFSLSLPQINAFAAEEEPERGTSCGYEEHTHSDKCYEKKLICTISEEGHRHTDDCYSEPVKELTCTFVPHTHADECYYYLSCTQPETDGHAHGEGCMDEEGNIICGMEEMPAHYHGVECWSTSETPLCGLEEAAEHEHTEECYTETKTLTCTLSELGHVHKDDCYEKKLTCKLEEHKHIKSCYSDPNMDVETPEDWDKIFENVKYTGSWPEDLVRCAEKQVGYMESIYNYVGDTEIFGYTRYGDFYRDPYAEWCGMFVGFNLHYAHVPEEAMPSYASVPNWQKDLLSRGMFKTPDEYTPKRGDLIFFDFNARPDADHIGIVETVDTENGKIRTIEGNNYNQSVAYFTYKMSDPNIMGYGVMPENPDYIPPDAEAETSPWYTTVSSKWHFDGGLFSKSDSKPSSDGTAEASGLPAIVIIIPALTLLALIAVLTISAIARRREQIEDEMSPAQPAPAAAERKKPAPKPLRRNNESEAPEEDFDVQTWELKEAYRRANEKPEMIDLDTLLEQVAAKSDEPQKQISLTDFGLEEIKTRDPNAADAIIFDSDAEPKTKFPIEETDF